jgi:hypothetical protein
MRSVRCCAMHGAKEGELPCSSRKDRALPHTLHFSLDDMDGGRSGAEMQCVQLRGAGRREECKPCTLYGLF